MLTGEIMPALETFETTALDYEPAPVYERGVQALNTTSWSCVALTERLR